MNNFFKKHLGWVITGFLTLLFFMQTCNLKNKIEQRDNEITQLELSNQTLQTTVNKQGQTIQRQTAIITHSKESLSNLTDTIFNLRRKDAKNLETIAYYKGITRVQIDSVHVPYIDTVAMKKFSDSIMALTPPEVLTYIRDSTIRVPRSSSLILPDTLTLKATATKTGILIDQLILPDTLQLRFVETKGNLFRDSKTEVQYFHSNPYVINVSANSAIYKYKRPSFFKRVILPVAIGVGAGILIAK